VFTEARAPWLVAVPRSQVNADLVRIARRYGAAIIQRPTVEALLLDVLRQRPQVVIVSLSAADPAGVAVVRALRRMPRRLCIVGVAAKSCPELEIAARQSGVSVYTTLGHGGANLERVLDVLYATCTPPPPNSAGPGTCGREAQ
jgi:DNA-binding NarL/FixJ family response regulator